MHVFKSQVLSARALLKKDVRRLVTYLTLHIAVVECVSAKQYVLLGKTMVDSALREVFIRRLGSGKEILRDSAPAYWTILARKKNLHYRIHVRAGTGYGHAVQPVDNQSR